MRTHRNKRALINALGTAIKIIAGNPDNDDVEIIHKSLGELQTRENELVRNQVRQIQINELFKNKINNITDSLSKINNRISKQYNSVQGLRSDLEFVNLIWNTDKIIHILESIEEQIEFSRIGLLNKNLLSVEEKILIFEKLVKQNLKLNYLDEIFQYSTASIGISKGQAVVLIKTPILDERSYDLLELHTLNINETRIDTHINLVAKHGDLIYSQTSKCEICEGNNLVEDDCIYKILTHQTPTCPLVKTKQSFQVNEIVKGIILIDTADNTEVRDSCGNSKMVREATIIDTGNCTIGIRNFTFTGKPDVMHQDDFLVPIYSKPLQNTSLTNNDEENFMLRILNLEELSEVQISLNQTHRWVTFGGAILLALTFFCSIAYFYRKVQAKFNEGKRVSLPQLIIAKPVGEDETTSEVAKVTRNTVTREPQHMTSSTDIPKHQPRTLDTYGGRRYEETCPSDHANVSHRSIATSETPRKVMS